MVNLTLSNIRFYIKVGAEFVSETVVVGLFFIKKNLLTKHYIVIAADWPKAQLNTCHYLNVIYGPEGN